MLNIESLKAYGADVETGLTRCVGMEDFYLKLINAGLEDANFDKLGAALNENDLQQAFEAAHALKGVIGNLALDPFYDAICEIVEPLRIKDESVDYDALYAKILEHKKTLEDLNA